MWFGIDPKYCRKGHGRRLLRKIEAIDSKHKLTENIACQSYYLDIA